MEGQGCVLVPFTETPRTAGLGLLETPSWHFQFYGFFGFFHSFSPLPPTLPHFAAMSAHTVVLFSCLFLAALGTSGQTGCIISFMSVWQVYLTEIIKYNCFVRSRFRGLSGTWQFFIIQNYQKRRIPCVGQTEQWMLLSSCFDTFLYQILGQGRRLCPGAGRAIGLPLFLLVLTTASAII